MEENMQEKLEEIAMMIIANSGQADQMPSLHCRRRKKEISKTQRNF